MLPSKVPDDPRPSRKMFCRCSGLNVPDNFERSLQLKPQVKKSALRATVQAGTPLSELCTQQAHTPFFKLEMSSKIHVSAFRKIPAVLFKNNPFLVSFSHMKWQECSAFRDADGACF